MSSPGANNPKTSDTFCTITPSQSPEYIVMLGIKDWSYSRQLMCNKGNVEDGPVEAMANLQINDSLESAGEPLFPCSTSGPSFHCS